VRERVPKRTGDPARQEALLGLAERLNPANWTDADQIAAGLQQAAEALERLSHVFARRRRRSRRAQPAAGATAAPTVDGRPDTAVPTSIESSSVAPSHLAPSHPAPSHLAPSHPAPSHLDPSSSDPSDQ
jgi:hypothetical protein